MINVLLFSEEECLGIRAFRMHYFQAVFIFRSCRHDNIMWWQSPNICPVCTGTLEAAFICSDWGKKVLQCQSVTWRCCPVQSRRWGSGEAAAALQDELPLVSGELCSLRHGTTEEVETKGRHLKTHISVFFISSKFALVQSPPQQLHFSPTSERVLWQSRLFDIPFYSVFSYPGWSSLFLCFAGQLFNQDHLERTPPKGSCFSVPPRGAEGRCCHLCPPLTRSAQAAVLVLCWEWVQL